MSDLHGQIMNIQITSAGIGGAVEQAMKYDNDQGSRLSLAYKIGHRDARHAAAEIAAKQDALVRKLMEALCMSAVMIANRYPADFEQEFGEDGLLWLLEQTNGIGDKSVEGVIHTAIAAAKESGYGQ